MFYFWKNIISYDLVLADVVMITLIGANLFYIKNYNKQIKNITYILEWFS